MRKRCKRAQAVSAQASRGSGHKKMAVYGLRRRPTIQGKSGYGEMRRLMFIVALSSFRTCRTIWAQRTESETSTRNCGTPRGLALRLVSRSRTKFSNCAWVLSRVLCRSTHTRTWKGPTSGCVAQPLMRRLRRYKGKSTQPEIPSQVKEGRGRQRNLMRRAVTMRARGIK